MHLDWILNPLAQYAVLAAGLFACLALFLAVKREMARCADEHRNREIRWRPRSSRWSRRWRTSARASRTWKNGRARSTPV